MINTRSGAVSEQEMVSNLAEVYVMHTTIDITHTGDYADATQKDFEGIMQVIGLRAQPIIINNPVKQTGAGWKVKFAFEREGAHSLATLKDELHGIVLNGGTVDTKNTVNTEFTKQDLL